MLFDYIAGPSKLRFFKELWAVPTTNLLPDDDKDTQLTKLAKRLQYLTVIAEGIEQTWFKMLEEVLMAQVKQLDNSIHDAVLAGNERTAMTIAVERTGIVTLFHNLHEVHAQIAQTKEQIETIMAGDDPRSLIEETINA